MGSELGWKMRQTRRGADSWHEAAREEGVVTAERAA
jgi:hypothetical protein